MRLVRLAEVFLGLALVLGATPFLLLARERLGEETFALMAAMLLVGFVEVLWSTERRR